MKTRTMPVILSVDDNETNRYVRTKTLARAGYEVIEADTGEIALRLADERSPDLILLDVRLPDYHGSSVCRLLRQNPRTASIAILQISASAIEPRDMVVSLDSGADSYLLEPVDPDVLLASVRALLRLRSAEERLAAANAALQARNDELQQFAYLASHDLQEPLRTVQSHAQLLQRRWPGGVDAETGECFTHIVEGVRRMHSLIEDLLTYSRLTVSEQKYDERVDTNGVLRFTLAALASAIEESQGEITSDRLPVVRGNASQVAQVFQNLLGNALKYRRTDAPPRVHVSATQKDDRWEFAVTDNGMGIEPMYFQRIFEPFKRLHGREYPGTGIGLALCRRIVEAHGGHLWVESEVGVGSTFRFTLPAVTSAEAGA